MGNSRTVLPPLSSGQIEPTWSVAHLYPSQGTWTEEYLDLIPQRGYEFCEGRVEMLPIATQWHQLIVGFLYRKLSRHVEERALGLVLFAGLRVRVRSRKIREPDIVFMAAKNAHRRGEKFWQGADLVMEVVSEDDPDWVKKRREYAAARIAEYWIVDPRPRTITVLTLKGGTYVRHGEFGEGKKAGSALLPEFSVGVRETFKKR